MNHLSDTSFGTLALKYSELRRKVVDDQLRVFHALEKQTENIIYSDGLTVDVDLETSVMGNLSAEGTCQNIASPGQLGGFFEEAWESNADDD